ncbi:MAG: heme ABC exporter ATP-binding protein CcmA [Proteobacteria bacterium]|nr:heme ABC exporter ATP-binding protein CcmA [Pseudomonadota bacterium]
MSTFAGHGLECTRSERIVFAGLDFAVESGAVLILSGPNGVGKSSLLRLMAGLLEPAAGRITWDGAPMNDDPEAHGARLDYLGHLDGVKGLLSVAENLRFWTGLGAGLGTGHGAPDGAIEGALEATGLARLADLPSRFLSAGQRRRLALARIIAGNSPLWLLDEPTSGLDTDAVGAFENAVDQHCRSRQGMAVIATHQALSLEGARVLELSPYAEKASVLALQAVR